MSSVIDSIFPTISLEVLKRAKPDLQRLPYNEIVRRRIMVTQLDGQTCVVASRECGVALLDWLQNFTLDVTDSNAWLCDEVEFEIATRLLGDSLKALPSETETLVDTVDDEPIENLSLASLAEEPNPIVKLLGSTLFDASRSRASDIHIETHATGATIKYRLDGMLISALEVHSRERVEQLVSRLKVLSALDVGERRLPQDGRLRVALDGRRFELRVSILPGIFGENAVLRLLDRSGLSNSDDLLSLEHLGLGVEAIERIRFLSRKPHGMLLVTGPTGSGKTTTLYGALSEINDSFQKIITIEDPVEYQLKGILQVPVNDKTGLTFSRGLRAILRHDPDTILVGEIRDPETAQIAIQAAMTGHLVFSSVHANSAVDVIGRLSHMGVDAYNLASALNGVVSQRLVRKVCSECQQKHMVTPSQRAMFPALIAIEYYVKGEGCLQCRHTGYRGRVACAEVLELDDELREGIIERVSPRQLLNRAHQKGMVRIADQALTLIASGKISIEEYIRVAEQA
jgi:general secretion pathway protein E